MRQRSAIAVVTRGLAIRSSRRSISARVSRLTAFFHLVTQPSRAASDNVSWLALDRAWRLGVGIVVQLLVVRHLGPAGNGVLQSGLALAVLCAVAVELGLDGIVKRELVRTPDRGGALLGTAVALRVAALVPGLAVFAWAAVYEPGMTRAMMVWLGITVALPIAQTPEAWLLATGRVPACVATEGSVFLLSALVRLGLVLGGATVVAFGAVAAGETLLMGVGLGAMFAVCARGAHRWRCDAALARTMVRDAVPLLLTTFAITVYRRIDVVLLSHALGPAAAGTYAAAVRISEFAYLAPMVLHNAWFPRLTQLQASDPAAYRAAIGQFFRRVTWSGAAFAAGLTLSAPWLVPRLFGAAFADAAGPLAIHAWTAVFIAHGIARSQWLLLENRQLDGLWLALGGAVANVALNLLLVPRLGVTGAAIAAVGALAINMAALPLLTARTRHGWALGWRAVFLLPARG